MCVCVFVVVFVFWSLAVKGKERNGVVYGMESKIDSSIFKKGEITAYLNADKEKVKREVKIDNAGEGITGVMYLSRQEGMKSGAQAVQ